MIRTVPPGPGRHRLATGWIAGDARASGEDGRSFALISPETDRMRGTHRAAAWVRAGRAVRTLELEDSRTFDNSVISLTYRKAEA
jgi:hypothetical protein